VPTKKEIIVGTASAAIIFVTLFASGMLLLNDPMLRQMVGFSLTVGEIVSLYPLPMKRQAAFEGAERALFSLLDPFSYRIDKDDYQYLQEESTGEYGGVGITVVARDTFLMVITVREGGPAYDGGMKSGDCIISVDGTPVPVDNPGSATDMIRGPSGSEVQLTIYRPTIDDTLNLTLTRSNIKLEHLPYYGLTESGCAYIRVADFEAGAADDLEKAVEELEKHRPHGYIIDLKGNPGGYLKESIDAADLFLDDGRLIVGTAGRSRWENRRYVSSSDPLTNQPVIILTNRGTASAAEIFTGALRGDERCVVIGDTTFGKGLVQSVYGLPNQDAIRLTISRYFFADGRYLNPPDSDLTFSGLAPDIVYDPPGEIAFQEIILSGFLIYDFVETEWDLLSSYPDHFNYPDTVITLFQDFAAGRGLIYESWMTENLIFAVADQYLSEASDPVIDHLNRMLDQSQTLDRDVYHRHADLLKYHIRRLTVEKKTGRSASYHDVIVPARPDIRLAEEILTDPERYRSLVSNGSDSD
jgi:carboxyl-terminal processing protease